MMLVTLCALALSMQSTTTQVDDVEYLNHGREPFAYVRVRHDPLDPPKLSPKRYPPGNQKWEFNWLTTGFVRMDKDRYDLRFRVFSQARKPSGDQAKAVARMGLRLWELLATRMSTDHMETQKGIHLVDIYLAWGGEAGGEQAFLEDIEAGRPREANMIAIYDIESFTEPLEMAREVAHEYGHATLAAIGGFESPEDWGNGYLGEKLFLRWIRDEMLAGRLTKDDVMGARVTDLDAWVAANVTPLVRKAAAAPPNMKVLSGKGQKAMDEFLGLALYADSILPDKVFTRTLRLVGSMKAVDYPRAMVLACSENNFTLEIPSILEGKPIWIPLGNGHVINAKVLAKAGNWVQIQPLSVPVKVIAPKEVTGQG